MPLKRCLTLATLLALGVSSSTALAYENEELYQATRQLDAVKSALLRAKAEARIEHRNIEKRAYFDHDSAIRDVEQIKQGILYYLNPSRLQPRSPEAVKALNETYHKVKKDGWQ